MLLPQQSSNAGSVLPAAMLAQPVPVAAVGSLRLDQEAKGWSATRSSTLDSGRGSRVVTMRTRAMSSVQ